MKSNKAYFKYVIFKKIHLVTMIVKTVNFNQGLCYCDPSPIKLILHKSY